MAGDGIKVLVTWGIGCHGLSGGLEQLVDVGCDSDQVEMKPWRWTSVFPGEVELWNYGRSQWLLGSVRE